MVGVEDVDALDDVLVHRQTTLRVLLLANLNMDWSRFTEVPCHLLDLLRPRGREHESLPLWVGDLRDDLPDVAFKAHVQHSIRLIEHQVRHPTHVGLSSVQEVKQSARCCDDYVHSVSQHSPLIEFGHSSVDTEGLEVANLREFLGFLLNLHGQLSGWRHN